MKYICGTFCAGLALWAAAADALEVGRASISGGAIQVAGSHAQKGASINWEGTVVTTVNAGGAFQFSSTNLPWSCVGRLSDGVTTIDVVVTGCATDPSRQAGVLRTGQTVSYPKKVFDVFTLDGGHPSVSSTLAPIVAIPKVIDDAARSGATDYTALANIVWTSGGSAVESMQVPLSIARDTTRVDTVGDCWVAIRLHEITIPSGLPVLGEPENTYVYLNFDQPVATDLCSSVSWADDGALQKGLARSYVDNGDGTITDRTTGLTWEKLTHDGSIHQYLPNKWTALFSIYEKIANLNAAAFAGHRDWRLPNINELLSIVEYSRSVLDKMPLVNPVFDNGVDSFTDPGKFYSSTADGDSSVYVGAGLRRLDFYTGQVDFYPVYDVSYGRGGASRGNVRAVRGP